MELKEHFCWISNLGRGANGPICFVFGCVAWPGGGRGAALLVYYKRTSNSSNYQQPNDHLLAVIPPSNFVAPICINLLVKNSWKGAQC